MFNVRVFRPTKLKVLEVDVIMNDNTRETIKLTSDFTIIGGKMIASDFPYDIFRGIKNKHKLFIHSFRTVSGKMISPDSIKEYLEPRERSFDTYARLYKNIFTGNLSY